MNQHDMINHRLSFAAGCFVLWAISWRTISMKEGIVGAGGSWAGCTLCQSQESCLAARVHVILQKTRSLEQPLAVSGRLKC